MSFSKHIAKSFTKETKRFIISLIQSEDLPFVFETMNSQKTAEIISFLQWPMTLSQAEKWCQKAISGHKAQTDFLFLVRDRKIASPVGCICLLKAIESDAMEVGYWVTETWQGKGCATEMLKAMIEVAFEEFCVTKLIATAATGNPASLRVLEKQGFQIIGIKELPTAKGTPLICHLLELQKNLTILCFGDSNVWGNIPGSFDPITGLCRRYEKTKRWTGILQNALGEKYQVVEEAINGCTTTLDEIIPGRPYKNGLTLLPPALEAHYPIHVVVFMLGTNDTKVQYNRNVEEITEGMRQLINIVKTSNKGDQGNPPKILIIAPQPIINIPNLPPGLNTDSIKKSEGLGKKYQQLAKEESCEFLDASIIVTSSYLDSLHLDENGSKLLGKAVAKAIMEMI